MSRRRFTGALALLLLLAASASPQGESAPESPKVFREAKRVSAGSSDSFEFELGSFTYKIAWNGAGRRIKGDSTRRFNLRLDGGDFLERVYYALHRENVILLCEVTDGESSAGFVARLEQPSMRARWRRHIPAFNLGPGLIEEEHVYLTGIGFVARLDLREGEYVWKHEDLYRKGDGGFNSFETPTVEGDAVLFKEKPARDAPARTLRVHQRTGKILGGIEKGSGVSTTP
jgi:hypothetical protein